MKTAKTFTRPSSKKPSSKDFPAKEQHAEDPAKKEKSSLTDEAPLYTLVPVSVLRCALFGVGIDGDEVTDFTPVIVDRRLTGAEIRYKGPYLNQDHLKLWQACIFLARETVGLNGDQFIVTNFADLLRLSGRSTGDSRQYRRTWKLLKDLGSAEVEISTSRVNYFGRLILEAVYDKATGKTVIQMSQYLKQFMSNETLSNDMLRLAGLGKDQLASWLHNYYASQKEPPKLTVSEIKELSGSKLDLPRLRQRIKGAMGKLKGGMRPLVLDWKLDKKTDTLFVKKAATTVDMRAAEAAAAAAFARRMAAEAKNRERAKKSFKTQAEHNRPGRGVVL